VLTRTWLAFRVHVPHHPLLDVARLETDITESSTRRYTDSRSVSMCVNGEGKSRAARVSMVGRACCISDVQWQLCTTPKPVLALTG